MTMIKIDGEEYEFESLSNESKAHWQAYDSLIRASPTSKSRRHFRLHVSLMVAL